MLKYCVFFFVFLVIACNQKESQFVPVTFKHETKGSVLILKFSFENNGEFENVLIKKKVSDRWETIGEIICNEFHSYDIAFEDNQCLGKGEYFLFFKHKKEQKTSSSKIFAVKCSIPFEYIKLEDTSKKSELSFTIHWEKNFIPFTTISVSLTDGTDIIYEKQINLDSHKTSCVIGTLKRGHYMLLLKDETGRSKQHLFAIP